MNKSELKQVAMIEKYRALGMTDTVARVLSALVRASRTNKSRAALLEYAGACGVQSHPEFIV